MNKFRTGFCKLCHGTVTIHTRYFFCLFLQHFLWKKMSLITDSKSIEFPFQINEDFNLQQIYFNCILALHNITVFPGLEHSSSCSPHVKILAFLWKQNRITSVVVCLDTLTHRTGMFSRLIHLLFLVSCCIVLYPKEEKGGTKLYILDDYELTFLMLNHRHIYSLKYHKLWWQWMNIWHLYMVSEKGLKHCINHFRGEEKHFCQSPFACYFVSLKVRIRC